MGRRWARQKTFQLLYQMSVRDDKVDAQIEAFIDHLKEFENEVSENALQISAEDLHYIRTVSAGVIAERESLDEEIQTYLKSWTLERLPRVDRALLRLAAYEIKHLDDVPKSVSINEIVVLAKEFAGEDAHIYLNGVLANFQKDEATPSVPEVDKPEAETADAKTKTSETESFSDE